jgi:membrane fusion protein (multidrug efflux system)
MGIGFYRTISELEGDSPRNSIWVIVLVTLVLGVWLAWLSLARVAVYRSTERARLIGGTGYEADSSAAGRVIEIRMRLGQTVTKGESLVVLDSGAEQRQIDEDQTREADLTSQIKEIYEEINAETTALKAAQQTTAVALNQARIDWNGSEKTWQIADNIYRRYQAAKDVVPQIALLKAEAEAQADRAKADNQRLEMARLTRDANAQESDREARIEQLREEARRLEGDRRTAVAEVKRLQYEIEKHRARVPVDGHVAAISPIRVGAFVHEGDRLAIIVPATTLRAVAEFTPSSALGLIKPGQPAWLHLNGFPWTQYGSVLATVASVASEPTLVNTAGDPEDERIRVELRINPQSAPLIPSEYGLPGSAEIEVERISPARLIMRAAGQLISKPSTAH